MSHLRPGTMHFPPLHSEGRTNAHRVRHDLFRGLSMPDMVQRTLEKIRSKEMLSPIESARALLEGNREHISRVSEFTGKFPKKITALMLICADARMGGMFDFDDFAKRGIVPVFVAGNVSDILSTPSIKKILNRMDKNSAIHIMGHSKCGAVHSAGEKHKYEKLHNIAHLLHRVLHTSEEDNLRGQAKLLSESTVFKSVAAKRNVRIVTSFVDIAHQAPNIRLTEEKGANGADAALISRLNETFSSSNQGMDLSEHQYAHAVVISSPALQFDAREIFSSRANEIFAVSAGDFMGKRRKGQLPTEAVASAEMASLGMLDQKSIASVEYSVSKNNSRHIVLLHTDVEILNSWEKELLQKSDVVAQSVVSGIVEISTAVYDPATGRATFLRHLVNEDATSALQSAGMG